MACLRPNEILGKRLRQLRERAELSIQQLAEKAETSRAHISEIEEGKKNFTGPVFDRLVRLCNSTPQAAFEGIDSSDTPSEFRDLYWMLGTIVKAVNYGEEGRRLVDGIRVNLEAISEKAIRIKKGKSSSSSNHPREIDEESPLDEGEAAPKIGEGAKPRRPSRKLKQA